MSDIETNRQADAKALDDLEAAKMAGQIGTVIQTRPGVYEHVRKGDAKRTITVMLAPYPQPENNGAKR